MGLVNVKIKPLLKTVMCIEARHCPQGEEAKSVLKQCLKHFIGLLFKTFKELLEQIKP